MASFLRSYAFLYDVEGGDRFVDHPSDPGGCTKFGISLRWYKRNVKKDATCEDIKALDNCKASELYKKHFWDPYKYYALTSELIAERVFSLSVHANPKDAVRVLQRAVNTYVEPKLKIDGILGPKTIAATNAIFELTLLPELRQKMAEFYRRLVAASRPRFDDFEKGWENRAHK